MEPVAPPPPPSDTPPPPEPAPAAAPGTPPGSPAPQPTPVDPAPLPASPIGRSGRGVWLAALLFGGSLLACLLAYLVLALPGRWFPSATPVTWGPADLRMARGLGVVQGNELLVTGVDPAGMAVVSLNADLRAVDFPAIAWNASNVPEDVTVHMIWSTDVQPRKINSAPVNVVAGQLAPVILNESDGWIGRARGLGLVFRGNLAKPVKILSVTAKPMGAIETLRDRGGEWLAFEPWVGASINTVVGGGDVQNLPLPPLMATAFGIAVLLLLLLWRFRPGVIGSAASLAGIGLAIFSFGWLVLDARWMWNLARQEQTTLQDYGGKTLDEKHLAAEDGALYAFVQKARAAMPQTPARVFIVSDEAYFRSRAAYHLFPHNSYVNRVTGEIPNANSMRPGDWIFAYMGRGIQYNPTTNTLRWGGGQTVTADVKLVSQGGALFQVR